MKINKVNKFKCGDNMTSYSLDAETFISEVKKYPEIWNLNCESNKVKLKKQSAWEEVAKVFIHDLHSMSEADKFEVFHKLHNKWRNIRDAYVRNLKRREGRRSYMYAKQLTFLNAVYVQCHDQNQDSENETSEEETKKKFRPRHIEVAGVDNNTYNSEEEGTSMIDNLKRRRLTRTENIEFVNAQAQNDVSYQMEDEDRSFFDSVLPAVREFNMDQKLEFRSEVLRLIKTIRSTPQMLRGIKMDVGIDYSE